MYFFIWCDFKHTSCIDELQHAFIFVKAHVLSTLRRVFLESTKSVFLISVGAYVYYFEMVDLSLYDA